MLGRLLHDHVLLILHLLTHLLHEYDRFHHRKIQFEYNAHQVMREDFNYISAYTECTTLEINIITSILYINKFTKQLIAVFSIPTRSETTSSRYSSGEPKPYIHETLATIITSSRSNNADVAE